MWRNRYPHTVHLASKVVVLGFREYVQQLLVELCSYERKGVKWLSWDTMRMVKSKGGWDFKDWLGVILSVNIVGIS